MEKFIRLGVLNIQKRCRWTEEKLNAQKEGENGFFGRMLKAFGICGPSGCRASLLMREAALALCERPDFVELNSSIPTELNVSRTKPDKTGTVN